jgi:predicted CXXCH cytochrome family protein
MPKKEENVKKLLLVTVVVLAMALAIVGLASANGGPHGGYTATTDACAGCHRAHTAIGPNLLIDISTYAFCMSCHGNAGNGADSNVVDGVWVEGRNPADTTGDANTADGASLLGGGFTNYNGTPVTSAHDMAGAGNTNVAWGNGLDRGVGAAIMDLTFTCASCHDPHGSPNYRIINATVNGVGVAVAQVDEGAAKDYDTEQWSTGTSDFCAACHGAYHVTRANSGTDNTDDGAGNLDYGGDITTFSHRLDMPYSYGSNSNPETVGMGGFTLPLAETGINDTVVCMTCHLPHGSSAVMSGFADGGPTGIGTLPGDTTATDSALLRLDNRGVCEVCHQK